MGQQYNALTAKHIEFIQQQKMYFVASATADSRVNLSPKGQDSLHQRALILIRSCMPSLNFEGFS